MENQYTRPPVRIVPPRNGIKIVGVKEQNFIQQNFSNTLVGPQTKSNISLLHKLDLKVIH